ncbi:MAG: hypothetical protein LBK71_01205 [Verrucomicrobiales bacterium]|nr:hypothetical protein [Verrucomicrobiales bacterium]
MSKAYKDFIPHQFNHYAVWLAAFYLGASALKGSVAVITDEVLDRLKQMAEEIDEMNRLVLLCEELKLSVVALRKDLLFGADRALPVPGLAAPARAELRGGQQRWLRRLIARIKVDAGYSAQVGRLLAIVSTVRTQDALRDRPLVKAAARGGRVVLTYNKHGYAGAHVFSRVSGEEHFSLLDFAGGEKYVDRRPFPAAPQVREYFLCYVGDTRTMQDIGQTSAVTKILVQAP